MYQSSIAKMEIADAEVRRPIRLNEAVTLAYIFGESLEVMLLGPQEERAEKIRALESQIRDIEAEMYAADDDFEDRLTRLRADLENERHEARIAELKNLYLNREINHIDPAETARRARKKGQAKP